MAGRSKPATAKLKHGPDFETNAERLFAAWRELRRGPVRSLTSDLYGSGRGALAPTLLDALELLLSRPRWRVGEFAVALHVNPSTASRVLDRLVRAGAAQRVQAESDGRGVVLTATRAGRAQFERIVAARQSLVQEFLRDFDDGEVEQLTALMERLAAGVARVAQERHLA